MSTRIALAAFDMAGTTVDEHGDVYRALRDCVEETGATVSDEDLQTWMGADKTEAIRALLAAGAGADAQQVDDAQVSACFDRFREFLAEFYRANPPVALPGIPAALAELRAEGIAVALTTGFSRDVAQSVLEALGWAVRPHDGDAAGEGSADSAGSAPALLDPAFTVDALVCADEVAAGRPYPYMIHRAMERTGVADVRSVLVAGDTALDMAAGRASGAAHIVGVLTGKLTGEDFADTEATAVLGSVAEVPALLRSHR
ncbi:phosphonatase-like hydrolase [Brevibacterium pityocampae]